MKSWLSIAAAGAGCFIGVAAAEWVVSSVSCRDTIAMLFGRGHLLALVNDRGIYSADLKRALTEAQEASGDTQDRHPEEQETLRWLTANAAARVSAERVKVPATEIDRDLQLLRWLFRDDKEMRSMLRKSGLVPVSLRRATSDDLRARRWILQQIVTQIRTTPDECRAFYEMHTESFSQPERFRASHLFLAAPPETPPEIVEQKRSRIEALSQRLAAGEDFFELVAAESEDEQTKARGGDLGFFAESRMPADFFAAIRTLQRGRISPPIQTQLGFHLVLLTDSKPPRRMTFDEVAPEIALRIANEKRRSAVLDLASELVGRAKFARLWP